MVHLGKNTLESPLNIPTLPLHLTTLLGDTRELGGHERSGESMAQKKQRIKWLINDIIQLINGINQFIDGISRLVHAKIGELTLLIGLLIGQSCTFLGNLLREPLL